MTDWWQAECVTTFSLGLKFNFSFLVRVRMRSVWFSLISCLINFGNSTYNQGTVEFLVISNNFHQDQRKSAKHCPQNLYTSIQSISRHKYSSFDRAYSPNRWKRLCLTSDALIRLWTNVSVDQRKITDP